MEYCTSIWKANLRNGIIMGLIALVYTLVIYFLNLLFTTYQGYLFFIVQALVLLVLIKSYSKNYKNGSITYGQAVSCGIVISLYTAIIYSVFIYILYAFIDTDLVNEQLSFIEETFTKANVPQTIIDSGLEIQKKFLQPEIYAPTRLLSNFLGGAVLSFIVAIFIKKEGNALIDSSEKV